MGAFFLRNGHKKHIFRLFGMILCVTATLTACHTTSYHKCGGLVWNTLYNITYSGPPALEDSIMPVLDKVGASASAFDSLSLISRINRNETDMMDDILLRLMNTSMRISAESGGKFDPTVGPLVNAWGFGKGHAPSADTLRTDEILTYVGIGKCRIENHRLIKGDARMQFNFSAIAKGYGCDAVAEMMKRNGVGNYLIEIGGEIRASGRSPRGDGWCVSIDAPIQQADTIVHESMLVIDINKAYKNGTAGVATSGNYRNFHSSGSGTYGHTIDPVSGHPAKTDVVSATVIAANAMEADAYATAIMAMGADEARKMCRHLRLAAYIITTDGKVWSTPQFDKTIIRQ